VDDEKLMKKLLKKMKVASLVTNYPDVALRIMNEEKDTKK
jgi:hypothetical protein